MSADTVQMQATGLSCMYLAHHQLESLVISYYFTVVTTDNIISIRVRCIITLVILLIVDMLPASRAHALCT